MAIESVSSGGYSHYVMNPQIECALRDGINCKMAGDYNQALSLFNLVLMAEPNNVRALISKGNLFDLQGNFSEAIRQYDQAIGIDNGNAEAWYNKGVTLKKSGNIEDGTRHIQKGISLSMGEI
jgi:tetratricopeptide (TPR) repeat protein